MIAACRKESAVVHWRIDWWWWECGNAVRLGVMRTNMTTSCFLAPCTLGKSSIEQYLSRPWSEHYAFLGKPHLRFLTEHSTSANEGGFKPWRGLTLSNLSRSFSTSVEQILFVVVEAGSMPGASELAPRSNAVLSKDGGCPGVSMVTLLVSYKDVQCDVPIVCPIRMAVDNLKSHRDARPRRDRGADE